MQFVFIIVGVLRILLPMVLEKEYCSVIVNWFDRAKDRNGGQKTRCTKKPNFNINLVAPCAPEV